MNNSNYNKRYVIKDNVQEGSPTLNVEKGGVDVREYEGKI